jgi:hypothetical protein
MLRGTDVGGNTSRDAVLKSVTMIYHLSYPVAATRVTARIPDVYHK